MIICANFVARTMPLSISASMNHIINDQCVCRKDNETFLVSLLRPRNDLSGDCHVTRH